MAGARGRDAGGAGGVAGDAVGEAVLRRADAVANGAVARSMLEMRELGGYVHDTSMSVIYGPSDGHYVTGTWSDAAGAVAGKTRTAHPCAARRRRIFSLIPKS